MNRRQRSVALVGLGGSTAILAGQIARHHFLCDDAFISFRYARNLKDGLGLVWNRGEYVEGYTNFLWVVELAAAWAITGIPPETVAPALSITATFATLGVLAWVAHQTPVTPWRGAAVAGVALLFATNRTVAVWATGGLATRQFTLLVLLGTVLLWRHRRTHGHAALIAGSATLGLAELTRPEALMIGPLVLAWWAVDAWFRGGWSARAASCAFGPFALLVASHLGWRLWTYGDLLPNTFHAKSVGPWWDMGLQWWFVLGVENGLWLLLPLAVIGTVARWVEARDTLLLAGWIWMVPQAVHLTELGGDHFEWRMFDPFLPLLLLGAVDGMLWLASLAGARWRAGNAVFPALLVAALVYTNGLGEAHRQLAQPIRHRAEAVWLWVDLDPRTAPWVAWLPPVSWMLPAYNAAGRDLTRHGSGVRRAEHAVFREMRFREFGPYEAVAEAVPAGLVASEQSIGEFGYRLWSVEVIDENGLTDAVIARTPVAPEADRYMAHDRAPPPGYLASRGVRVKIRPAQPSEQAALKAANTAVALGRGVWMPLNPVSEHPMVLPSSPAVSRTPDVPVRDHVTHLGRWRVVRWLGRFDDGPDGWIPSDPSIPVWSRGAAGDQGAVLGHEGQGVLNTWGVHRGDRARAEIQSPPFRPAPGEALTLLIAGGRSSATEVRLVADGEPVMRWSGEESMRLRRVLLDLQPWVGVELRVHVVDASTTRWGHLVVDAVAIVERSGVAE